MTTSLEIQTIEQLQRKRDQLVHYINKIDIEIKKRNDIEIKKRNQQLVKLIDNKVDKIEKEVTNQLIKPTETKKIKTIKKPKITMKVIKLALDKKDIKYPSSASKTELEEIMRKNNLVRYVESLISV